MSLNRRQQPGEPIGILLRDINAADLRARLDAGEHLYITGQTHPPEGPDVTRRKKNRWTGPELHQKIRFPDGRLGVVVEIDKEENMFAVAEIDPAGNYRKDPITGAITKPKVSWIREER